MRILVLTLCLAGCATGSTYRSGVGDRLLQHPPYYAGAAAAPDSGRIGHLPVAYQGFEPAGGSGTPIAAFLADISTYLDSLGLTVRLLRAPPGTPPDVRFSCEIEAGGDEDECVMVQHEGALGRGDIVMRLAVARPSPTWVTNAGAMMDSAGVTSALVITLEIGQYRIRQSGLRGDKDVELGTDHVLSLPWLTSLETPIQVLQLTGARVGRDGIARRIGAEGLLARRTSLPVSALGGQAIIRDAEIEQARMMRRDDLPGQPLTWQVALRYLVRGLTGR